MPLLGFSVLSLVAIAGGRGSCLLIVCFYFLGLFLLHLSNFVCNWKSIHLIAANSGIWSPS